MHLELLKIFQFLQNIYIFIKHYKVAKIFAFKHIFLSFFAIHLMNQYQYNHIFTKLLNLIYQMISQLLQKLLYLLYQLKLNLICSYLLQNRWYICSYFPFQFLTLVSKPTVTKILQFPYYFWFYFPNRRFHMFVI